MEDEFAIQSFKPALSTNLTLQKKLLPIFKYREQLLYAIETFQVTLIHGHTGCGKTTQLPQYLYETGWTKDGKIIGCTQPRRLVARSVAARVSEELTTEVGKTCGYKIQFEHNISDETRIEYMTDGTLLKEILTDPLLERYSVIIIDEVHERTINIDLLLGILKRILIKRRDLRVILASASANIQKLNDFFYEKDKIETKSISIEGKLFPVDVMYLENPTENYVNTAIETVLNINSSYPSGDILVFLTDRREIEECVKRIESSAVTTPDDLPMLVPLPLHSGLTLDEQLRVFEIYENRFRKVIFSTNIAEASVTIDGIVYVVDCGFCKQRIFNPYSRVSKLIRIPISKSNAVQRMGRAGRTNSGKCFRLFPKTIYDSLKDESDAEISHSDLLPAVFFLKAIGLRNIYQFPFYIPPPTVHIIAALEDLYFLGAIDDYSNLTDPTGLQMVELPLDARLSKALLSSASYDCTYAMLNIVSVMMAGDVFYRPSSNQYEATACHATFTTEEGDILTGLNVFESFLNRRTDMKWCKANFLNYNTLSHASEIRKHILPYLQRFHISPEKRIRDIDPSKMIECLLQGFFRNVAHLQDDGSYRTILGSPVLVDHKSTLINKGIPWIMFTSMVEYEGRAFINGVSKIESKWLEKFYHRKNKK
ncbi:ATP-dependent RNA helicase [Schizosaccharomyces cryophilus OY26]|uniref:RNA helicase n=1 Tax=Schizosaccharomyces cryophilus (strain OY26 / ATCC MYA-4695 / CBS 11777 / NBRC 106824 / NRRL Y48691) TaxID=653667 RepID=S9VVD2_SCHCR|nr:ATP-dependent RNA helicase [Schizosaccharomyces cryophilus OY26]EPY51743.1 ATP-dependent RNA helicase [Schizosaccharomyces cryophilus OY26]